MGQRLSPEQMELYRRVDEVLHYLWDPIGISAVPEARDEYHAYLPHVFSLLVNLASETEIADFLVKTETETMGLLHTDLASKHTMEVVFVLTRYRDFIQKRRG